MSNHMPRYNEVCSLNLAINIRIRLTHRLLLEFNFIHCFWSLYQTTCFTEWFWATVCIFERYFWLIVEVWIEIQTKWVVTSNAKTVHQKFVTVYTKNHTLQLWFTILFGKKVAKLFVSVSGRKKAKSYLMCHAMDRPSCRPPIWGQCYKHFWTPSLGVETPKP